MDTYIVLVAGGKGLRMESETPKQFLLLEGKPLVMHTFEAFSAFFDHAVFMLVLPGIEIGRWKQLCAQYNFTLPHRIVEGGPTRFHSVKNALAAIPDKSMVCIHDAVRPLVNNETISNCFRTARIHGNAIPVVPLSESLRQVESGISRAVNRENFRIVQTPQVFQSRLIKKAYLQTYREDFTDDAIVLESNGQPVFTVSGNVENIKLTRPADVAYAKAILSKNRNV